MRPTPFLVAAAVLMAGCNWPLSNDFGREDIRDFEIKGIKIAQAQVGQPTGLYMGSIEFPVCIYNPNDYDIWFRSGWEVYQHHGGTDGGWRVVAESSSGPRFWPAHGGSSGALGMVHHVLYNETIEGGSTDYGIHMWHEIVSPGPVPRWDRWFNVTFTPYMTQTFYEEGEECNR